MNREQTAAAPTRRESTKSHWDNFWSEKKEVHEVYSNDDRVLRNLRKIIDFKDKRVLEVGAGTGRDSFGMVAQGATVFMLDYSPNSLKIIKSLAEEEKIDVSPVGGNAFSLPFPDESLDVVFHQGLLEHFREQQADLLLKENIRVLKHGGLLLVDVPQRYHIYTVMKHMLIAMDKWFAGWEREFSVGELERLLRALGVQPVYRYGEWMYPSLFYRVAREAFKKIGIGLPLNPRPVKSLANFRKRIREGLRSTPLVLNTSISCGVLCKKP